MFKRVNKKRVKRERKQQLEGAEEYLGLNDIDSDDSESSSSASGSASDDDSELSEQLNDFISVTETLETPIFSSEVEDGKKSCHICPGVLLKHERMAAVHLESNVGETAPIQLTPSSNLVIVVVIADAKKADRKTKSTILHHNSSNPS